MYHYRSRPHRKADRPILFRRPTLTAPPDEQAFPAPAERTLSNDKDSEAETRPSLFDLQLCYLLLWWMQQQTEAEVATQAQAAATIIVDSVSVQQPTDGLPPYRRRRALPWPLALLVGCGAGLVAVLLSFVIVPLLVTTTTVTILPIQTTLTTTATVALATGATKPLAPAIAGRMLSTLALSQARTVPTTGIGHQAAQAARGRVTFYNAALVVQTIPAGTLLVGADGTEIVTEQDAVLPAAQLPTEGQATVSAQAVEVGPQGNIGTGDLHGACCREDVFAENSAAFSGGQNARTYPMVTRHDLDSAVATLTTALDQSIQAAYTAQLAANEALVTPVPCTAQVSSTAQVGAEATTLTVTRTGTCTGVAYDQQALEALFFARMAAQVQAQLGSNALLLGTLRVTTQQVKREGRTLTLTVQGVGGWAYQFSEAELQHLAALVAGKSAQQASALLLRQPGVGEVALSASALPANPGQIRLVVLYRPL
ncbi:MAG TPA: hypothetical protein VGS80_05030 [Ktedonobacterales bacterium]|nr:hypothetical protein [Ktedonobacterales bacterium]